jgi:peptidoglycan-associated lipoprotein
MDKVRNEFDLRRFCRMSHQRCFSLSPFLMVLFLVFGMVGCSHNKPKTDETSSSDAIDEADLGTSDQGKAHGLQTIRFGYDSSLLDQQGKSLLAQNAEILKSHASAKVQIEGHCDNRGGIQYNIALGERRANSVKKYLEDMGVPGSRLTTISYGKERPLVSGDDEDAYAKNRRANFALTAK